jgi:hypothetical protein
MTNFKSRVGALQYDVKTSDISIQIAAPMKSTGHKTTPTWQQAGAPLCAGTICFKKAPGAHAKIKSGGA